ncbi:MAG TPA: M24 family metallopeptidase, partial [Herpetosiphonaceae bacterium]
AFVAGKLRGPLASDRPREGELPLPAELVAAKRRLVPEEIERYRLLGAAAAAAMTEVLTAAKPDWTEQQLAGAGAEALWRRGIHPTLTLAAGARRLPVYRHPTPGPDPLGERAMLVFCARRWGLYANLTRFVSFRAPTAEEERLFADVAAVEAAAWDASTPGASLAGVYEVLRATYAGLGYAGEIDAHHQGGTTGYLSREVVARPHVGAVIESDTALAWNPSLPGAKIEDTILVSGGTIEILTADPVWPAAPVAGRQRPLVYRA